MSIDNSRRSSFLKEREQNYESQNDEQQEEF